MEPLIIKQENSFEISMKKVGNIFQIIVHLFPNENFVKNYKSVANIINSEEITIDLMIIKNELISKKSFQGFGTAHENESSAILVFEQLKRQLI